MKAFEQRKNINYFIFFFILFTPFLLCYDSLYFSFFIISLLTFIIIFICFISLLFLINLIYAPSLTCEMNNFLELFYINDLKVKRKKKQMIRTRRRILKKENEKDKEGRTNPPK